MDLSNTWWVVVHHLIVGTYPSRRGAEDHARIVTGRVAKVDTLGATLSSHTSEDIMERLTNGDGTALKISPDAAGAICQILDAEGL